MSTLQPFRFAAYGSAHSRVEWVDYARKVESLGYSTLLLDNHIAWGGLAPLPALLTAADATSKLRLGIHVLDNNFRHPAMLAHEAATVDFLSDGRLELGVGMGWSRGDYEAMSIPFEPPSIRLEKLRESITLIKRLFQEESVTFAGEYYNVRELNIQPKQLQHPYPPLFIGGGGKHILSFAAQEATIIGLATKSTSGLLDAASITANAVTEKVRWVRDAASTRADNLELHIQAISVIITDDRLRGAEMAAQELAGYSSIAINTNLSTAQVLESPHILIGTVDQIVETLQERRERYGISYITLFGDVEKSSPIVERLAGK